MSVADERIAEMLEQARRANIGLILSRQTISQIRRSKLDPATVIGNTATKLVSTTYPDDAREMAKSMRKKIDDILDLPEFTFALYDRRQGFVEIKAPNNPLGGGEQNRKELKAAMEERYGVKSEEAISPPVDNFDLQDAEIV